jgi:peptidoglycan hydrolase-like protein with peptidoglycan-binding domain
VPFIDPANPGPWLASLSASRRRRAEARRQARRRRAGRGGGAALLACMTLVAGGAVAADGPASSGARAVSSASGTVALQRALGVAADGVIGPVTRRAIRNYQRNHGLVVDGIAGPATLGSLGISASTVKTKAPATRTTSGSGTLARIAQCESSGNPTAVSASGQYRGKYQFSRATWRSLGGAGDPAKAPESVQDAMAAKLLAQRGTSPWPVCG